jgi:hypothetical protein
MYRVFRRAIAGYRLRIGFPVRRGPTDIDIDDAHAVGGVIAAGGLIRTPIFGGHSGSDLRVARTLSQR